MKCFCWFYVFLLFRFVFAETGGGSPSPESSGILRVQAELIAFPAERVELMERKQMAPLSSRQFVELAQQQVGRTLEKHTWFARLGEYAPSSESDSYLYPIRMEKAPENPGQLKEVAHEERQLGFQLRARLNSTQPGGSAILTLIGDKAYRLEPSLSEWPHLNRMTPSFRFWTLLASVSLPYHEAVVITESSARNAHERIVLLLKVAPGENTIKRSSTEGDEQIVHPEALTEHPGLLIGVHLRLLRIDADLVTELEAKAGHRFRTKDVLELWREGHMQTEWVQRVKTLNGENAIVDMGEEHIFPTHVELDEELPFPLFSDFEIQNSGWSLNVTPVFYNGRLDLKLMGTWTERFPDMNGNPLHPRFSRREISSSFSAKPGNNLLIGHSTSPDRTQRWYWLLYTELER